MNSPLSDTTPDADQLQLKLLATAPAWRKIAMLGEMWETVCLLAESGLRQRYPAASPTELRRRLADVLLGEDLAARAYGPLPQEANR